MKIDKLAQEMLRRIEEQIPPLAPSEREDVLYVLRGGIKACEDAVKIELSSTETELNYSPTTIVANPV